MNKPTRIIDTHQHVFWWNRNDAGLIADMDEQGIEYAWLLSWEIAREEHAENYVRALNPIHTRSDGTHRGIPLEDLILAKQHYPDRFVLGFCPHPLRGDAPERLRTAVSIHGVQVCGEWKFRTLFDDPRSIELFRTAGKLSLPVVLHLDVPYLNNENGEWKYQPLWYGGTVENLERALIACPETTFIGHAPGFWREISADADEATSAYPKGSVKAPGKVHRLLEKYDNLYADLSAGSGRMALGRDPEHATKFLKQFSEKLFFARDYYGGELHQFLSTLNLDQETVENIYWRNAEKLVPKPKR